MITNYQRNCHNGFCDSKISFSISSRTKFTVLLLGLFCFSIANSVYAQQVTLAVNKEKLINVIKELRKQSKGYDFAFNANILEKANPVTVTLAGSSLEKALAEIFKGQPLTYEINNNTIVIKERKDQKIPENRQIDRSESQQNISGRVTDEAGSPIAGATIRVKGTSHLVITDKSGIFELSHEYTNTELEISYIGRTSIQIIARDAKNIVLLTNSHTIGEVLVEINTGYQTIPKERATGSFVQISNKLLNRAVTTNLMERLNGLVPGLQFTDISNNNISLLDPNERSMGIIVRGISSLSNNVSKAPLIVVDNFPYEGDIRNINPNDVENITVLKDAAAASIWGSRAGNGVIVITTKKGGAGIPPTIEFNTNFTIQNKPNLWYDRNFLNSADYIDVETLLYNSGYFNSNIADNTYYRPVSPAVNLLNELHNSTSEKQKANLLGQLDALKQRDIRNDYTKYVYQKSIKQQYSIGFRGGYEKWNYSFFSGYDKNIDNLKRNGYDRISINSQWSFRPFDKLEINSGIFYSQSKTQTPNQFNIGYGKSIESYTGIYPYAQFVDKEGRPDEIIMDFKPSYKQQALQQRYMDWGYRPIDEINNRVKFTKISDIILKLNLNYKIHKTLMAQLYYQNERQTIYTEDYRNLQTYEARDLINRFSKKNPDGSFTYQIPNTGGIMDRGNYELNSNNFRTQLSFEQNYSSLHHVNAILGAELREIRTLGGSSRLYGFDKQFGSFNNGLNYVDFLQTIPGGTEKIPMGDETLRGKTNRYLSQYFNAGYNYAEKYGVSTSLRRDGANLFGVKTNDKITPLWSVGFLWNLHKEEIFKSNTIDKLTLRTTYGYNGNVYHGTSYVTGLYGSNSRLTGLPVITTLKAPNAGLRWERIKNINFGVDFSFWNNSLYGTLEYYLKYGNDLIQNIPLAQSTGFESYFNNSASTKANGWELNLTSNNLRKSLKWSTNYIISTYHDKITKYDVPPTAGTIGSNFMRVVGKPLYAVFSYKWAGLDPTTGEPMGFVKGQPSKDYAAIYNNFRPEDLDFHGSSAPTMYGSLRNDFIYRAFSLSFSLNYKFGYVFQKSSSGTSYPELLKGYGNIDYSKRWKQSGDERITDIPSVQLSQDEYRTIFYANSSPLFESASHIRFQDVKLSYEITKPFRWCRQMQAYLYASNLGIIWRANKSGIDPDLGQSNYTHEFPMPFSIAFGIKSTF